MQMKSFTSGVGLDAHNNSDGNDGNGPEGRRSLLSSHQSAGGGDGAETQNDLKVKVRSVTQCIQLSEDDNRRVVAECMVPGFGAYSLLSKCY
jgi:hypothetical protein